jgi:hypothetical protein
MYSKRFCLVVVTAVALAVVQAASVLAAGDVTAELAYHLEIIGDQADNEIAVYSDEDGNVWVEGREGTTINGGADPVQFDEVPPTLDISMGDGDDAVDVRVAGAMCLYIVGGRGDDEVVVKGGEFWQVEVWADTEEWCLPDGNDEVRIEDVIVGEEYARDMKLIVGTGDGNDDVLLRNVHARVPYFFCRTMIFLGSGHSQIVIDTIVADNFELSGGDLVELRGNSEAANASFYLGNGNDVLDAEKGASWGGSSVWVKGGKGRDTLINPDCFQTTNVNIDGFEVVED